MGDPGRDEHDHDDVPGTSGQRARHCIEGYLSKKSVPLGKSMALDGIGRIARHLRRAVRDGDDTQARAEMMIAAYAGGASIGMGLGPAHAVALSCCDQGFPHGVLSGIGLVTTLDRRHARRLQPWLPSRRLSGWMRRLRRLQRCGTRPAGDLG